jgi:hypothetical protein
MTSDGYLHDFTQNLPAPVDFYPILAAVARYDLSFAANQAADIFWAA